MKSVNSGPTKHQRQYGLTLLEMVLAMALSSLIILALAQAYQQVRGSYGLLVEEARLAENGALALQLFRRALSQSGAGLCSATDSGEPTRPCVRGYAAGAGWTETTELDLVADSDIVHSIQPAFDTYPYAHTHFFVSINPSQRPALYAMNWKTSSQQLGAAEEWIEGVAGLRLQFGVDGNGDGVMDAEQTAAQVTDWATVRRVRVTVLLQGAEPVLNEVQVVDFAGETLRFSDGYLRRVMATEIALRNRLP